MPGIYQRGSRYVVASRDATGHQRRRSAAAMAEARTLKAALTADHARGEYREQSRVTLNQYAREWVLYAGRTSRGIRPTNIEECWARPGGSRPSGPQAAQTLPDRAAPGEVARIRLGRGPARLDCSEHHGALACAVRDGR